MKRVFFLILMLLLLNCSKQPEAFIQYLDGYWEIYEVTLPEGTKKIYGYNDTIDYIKIAHSLNGFRTKLKPNLNGGYQTSKDVETFQLKIENNILNVYYSTPFSNWKETILSASENELLVINAAKVRYLYKRFQPLNISDEQTP